MALSSVAAGLIGAGIGAGGAVTAQIIASAFSAGRDSKRFAWERAKDERDEEQRRDERFLDLRRELYSEFLTICLRYLRHINPVPGVKVDTEPPYEELTAATVNIQIMTSNLELFNLITAFGNGVLKAVSKKDGKTATEEEIDALYNMFNNIRAVMRKELRGE